jgi:hypothetical protein
MTTQESLSKYIRDTGRTITWVARRAQELGCTTLSEKKLSAALSERRGMSADELLYICAALSVSPDMFMPEIA